MFVLYANESPDCLTLLAYPFLQRSAPVHYLEIFETTEVNFFNSTVQYIKFRNLLTTQNELYLYKYHILTDGAGTACKPQ